jgi:hypothetical protein
MRLDLMCCDELGQHHPRFLVAIALTEYLLDASERLPNQLCGVLGGDVSWMVTLLAYCGSSSKRLVVRKTVSTPAARCSRCPSPSTRHARRAKRWRGRGVAPSSAGSLGHILYPLAMRSPGGAALGVRADPRRGPQAAGGHGGCARGRWKRLA